MERPGSKCNREITRRQALRAGGLGLTGAGVALLFGCGDDGDEERSPASEPGRSSPSPTLAPGEDPPPEVTTIRVNRSYAGCAAALLAAHDYLLEEGFLEVHYDPTALKYSLIIERVVSGDVDFAFNFSPALLHALDNGEPLVMLGGAHVACFQIIAASHVRDLSDMRGRRLGMFEADPQPSDFAFLTSIMQHIGLTAGEDFELAAIPDGGAGNPRIHVLSQGFDAFMTLAPVTPELYGEGAHVILDSLVDDPWHRQLCCLVNARREFVEEYPIATRRALRAILRGIDRCAREPEAVARLIVEEGLLPTYASALKAMHQVSFDDWRSHNPEDTLRFYGLLLNKAGLVRSTPEEIIERGTDLTYFNELKQELAMFAAPPREGRAAALNCEIEGQTPAMARAGVSERERRALS
jgi:NitT/TauT family transport system substrate-binding protein